MLLAEQMPSREFVTRSTEETIERGREIGAAAKPPLLILLEGELGAGKTTLTKGIVTGLGAGREEEVTSPTFTLVHRYDAGPPEDPRAPRSRVYHVDLYRVSGFHDLETLGLEDLFSENAVVIIEWPDRLTLRTDWPILRVSLEHVDEESRRIVIGDSQFVTRDSLL